MRALFASLFLLIGLSVRAYEPVPSRAPQRASASLPESDLRASQPIVCQAMDRVELSRRHIITDGDGIEVNGACSVVVSESHIIAGGTGILVNGNGRVEIERSFVQGGEAAVVAHATSQAAFRDSTLRGGTAKYAMARISDGGGNALEDIPSAATSRVQSSEPIRCDGRDHINVISRVIETDGDGLVVEGDCDVLLSDSLIVAGGYAVRVSDNGAIRMRNSTLQGNEGALEITDAGRAHAAGCNLRGRIAGRLTDGGGNARR